MYIIELIKRNGHREDIFNTRTNWEPCLLKLASKFNIGSGEHSRRKRNVLLGAVVLASTQTRLGQKRANRKVLG